VIIFEVSPFIAKQKSFHEFEFDPMLQRHDEKWSVTKMFLINFFSFKEKKSFESNLDLGKLDL